MSQAGDIVTQILADAAEAIPGVSQFADARSLDRLPGDALPAVMILATDYEVEPIAEHRQQRRVWTVSGTVIQEGGTRSDMHAKLEAIRDQIDADPALAALVDHAYMAGSIVHSHEDGSRIFGTFVVRAEKVS